MGMANLQPWEVVSAAMQKGRGSQVVLSDVSDRATCGVIVKALHGVRLLTMSVLHDLTNGFNCKDRCICRGGGLASRQMLPVYAMCTFDSED